MTEKVKLLSQVEAIHWPRLQDEKDAEVCNRLMSTFCVTERVTLTDDVQSWDPVKPAR